MFKDISNTIVKVLSKGWDGLKEELKDIKDEILNVEENEKTDSVESLLNYPESTYPKIKKNEVGMKNLLSESTDNPLIVRSNKRRRLDKKDTPLLGEEKEVKGLGLKGQGLKVKGRLKFESVKVEVQEVEVVELPLLKSLHIMVPVLYLGCLLWWDYVPDSSSKMDVLIGFDVMEELTREMVQDKLSILSVSVPIEHLEEAIIHEFPHERAPLNIAMWISHLTLGFAIGLYALTN